jgi:hypothetical protein
LPIAVGLTTIILVGAALELAYGIFGPSNWRSAIGMDLTFYADAAERLFTGQGWYLDRQLHGPYQIVYFADVLYPPVAALVFAPFIILPVGVLLAAAVAVVLWLMATWKPAPWSWPLIGLCLIWPTTLLKGISGNSSLFVMIAVGLGLRFGWPGAFVLLKPSFLPLSLIGITKRGWWITLGILTLLSLPFLSDTLAYPRVILDSRSAEGFGYSLWDLPFVFIPILAWLGRSSRLEGEERASQAVNGTMISGRSPSE